MKKLDISIKDPEGLHARPASRLVRLCHSFESDIMIRFAGTEANSRNITEVLSLGAEKGDIISFVIKGSDEEEAVPALLEMMGESIPGGRKQG
jgi:phosphocarrier protein HPr